jgi:hypothetical protein
MASCARTRPLGVARQLRDPISESIAQKLGEVFQVSAADVLADAERVATWDGQLDDLLVSLEQRYGWSAQGALRYLLGIRSALEGELDSP